MPTSKPTAAPKKSRAQAAQEAKALDESTTHRLPRAPRPRKKKDPTPKPYTLHVNSARVSDDITTLITGLEGHAPIQQMGEAAGETYVVKRWHNGLEIFINPGGVSFIAATTYARALVDSVVAELAPENLDEHPDDIAEAERLNANEVHPLLAHGPFEGKYLLLALGSGIPEMIDVVGPLTDTQLAVMKNPRAFEVFVTATSALIVQPPSTANQPRILLEMNSIDLITPIAEARNTEALLEDILKGTLARIVDGLIARLESDEKAGMAELQRALEQRRTVFLRHQCALALQALGL